MLFLLLCLCVNSINTLATLYLYKILDYGRPCLPIILNRPILLHFPNNQYCWKLLRIFKTCLTKLYLSFIYHHDPLLVVIGHLELNDFVVRIADNCNDEVHEDHEEEEDAHHPDEESEMED